MQQAKDSQYLQYCWSCPLVLGKEDDFIAVSLKGQLQKACQSAEDPLLPLISVIAMAAD